jgi:hypothetical protein
VTTGDLVFQNQTTEQMRLDTSGNLGLGVTPSAWGSGYKALQINNGGLVTNVGGTFIAVTANAYWDGTNYRYVSTAAASLYRQNNGAHDWQIAPSGTVGNAITFTQAMTLDASGNLGIGTSLPTEKFEVSGNSAITGTGYLALQRQLIPPGMNGSTVLAFRWYSTGTTYTTGAQIQATSEAAWTSASAPARLELLTTASGSTTPTIRATIDSSGNLGIGTTASASAILDAQSTTKGVRMPNMTTTQKNAIASPAAGLMVFDTTLAKLCVYSGSAWQTITSV